jgi:uncharacterized protein
VSLLPLVLLCVAQINAIRYNHQTSFAFTSRAQKYTQIMVSFWAIADTHLSFAKPKDVSRFGELWINHAERIKASWQELVAPDDVVIIAGDVSWADKPSKVRADLEWLSEFPGRKIIIRGNHDHWWRSIIDTRALIAPFGLEALEADAREIDGVILCGTMGYVAPNDPYYHADVTKDRERYERELGRLESALIAATAQRNANQPLIVVLHYPPFTSDGQPTAFSEAISRARPTICLYGHLHRSAEWEVAVNEVRDGVQYRLIASDFVKMTLQKIW